MALFAAAVGDFFASEKAGAFRITRSVEDRFSMGAENEVVVKITNRAPRKVTFIVKDEYPPQMELAEPREVRLTVTPNRTRAWRYRLIPTARGSYEFGNTAVRIRSRLGLLWKQFTYAMLGRADSFGPAIAKFAAAPGWEPTFTFRLGVAEHAANPSPRRALEQVLRT